MVQIISVYNPAINSLP